MLDTPTERLQRAADEFVARLGNLAVLTALDVRGQERHYILSGHRDLAHTQAVTKDDIFQIGSQTKTITAIAVLLLVREGKLDFDASVARALGLAIDPRITARHLVMNTSGLGEYTASMLGFGFDSGAKLTPRDLVALALPQGQRFAPGDHFDYCNTGWVIAAMLVEAAGGKSFADFVAERILIPLGLSDTRIGNSGEWPRGRAACAYFLDPARKALINTATDMTLDWGFGAGNALSTCDDMLNLFGAFSLPKNAIDLGLEELTREMVRPNANPTFAISLGAEYGYGIERRCWAGRSVWGHPGKTFGYGTSTWIDPAAGVAVTTCVTGTVDAAEPDELAAMRYPGFQLFTLALSTAYALVDCG